jgi:predicted peptidase
MLHLQTLLVCLLACFLTGCAASRTTTLMTKTVPALSQGGLMYRSVNVDGVEHRYAVYLPREYRAMDTKCWPCVIFLNGSGECGTDGQRQLTQGLFPAMINAPQDWPMIAIFPQKPDRASTWLDHDVMVLATLRETQSMFAIDQTRIYLTGLSQGGAGTWAIASKHPAVFAAIAPVCGFLSGPSSVEAVAAGLGQMPVWALHGEKDDVVPIAQTQRLVDAVETSSNRTATRNPPPGSSLLPSDPTSLRFTSFPDLNHGCWDRAYRDMELGEWLLSFRKPVPQTSVPTTPVPPTGD